MPPEPHSTPSARSDSVELWHTPDGDPYEGLDASIVDMSPFPDLDTDESEATPRRLNPHHASRSKPSSSVLKSVEESSMNNIVTQSIVNDIDVRVRAKRSTTSAVLSRSQIPDASLVRCFM